MMNRPRLLDLFCGAGGCSVGYERAGFEVVGVDLHPQPNYPFFFVQADALEVLADYEAMPGWIDTFDVIHASPICQGNSTLRYFNPTKYADLITPTRELLQLLGKPWVIENVPGSPMRPDVILCGEMFGLAVQRHRWFELSSGPPAALVHPCVHPGRPVGVYGHGQFYWEGGEKKWRNVTRAEASTAMGIDWMGRAELSQAIPPAYTEWIGVQLMAHLEASAA